jgi:hypothetical protein
VAGTSTAPVLVLIDGNNVLRSRWPNLAAEEVARLSCRWAAEQGCTALVVFDRRAPDVPDAPGCTNCKIVGSGGRSADERLIDEAAELARRGERFWLVTSDRALRAAAGEHAERTIGGGSFVRTLEALAERD